MGTCSIHLSRLHLGDTKAKGHRTRIFATPETSIETARLVGKNKQLSLYCLTFCSSVCVIRVVFFVARSKVRFLSPKSKTISAVLVPFLR